MAYGLNAPFGLRPHSSINGGAWTERITEYPIYASADGTTTYAQSLFMNDPVVFTTNRLKAGSIELYYPNFNNANPSTFSTVPLLGTFRGCRYTDVNRNVVSSPIWPGATLVYPGTTITALIADDPNIVYEIQISTSRDAAANAFVANPYFPTAYNANLTRNGHIGSNFALNIAGGTNFTTVTNAYTAATGKTYNNNPATGNVSTGLSGFYLDASTTTAADNVGTNDYVKTIATLPLKVKGYSLNPANIAATGLTFATTPFLNVLVTINNHVFGHNSAGTTFA